MQVVMPVVADYYPTAKVQAKSLPSQPNHFFIIKYTADGKNDSFGLHVDHTEVTVNIALSDDFDGGGTFMRASSKGAPTEAGRSSQGFCLRPRPGTALVHNGEVAHAGNAITRGSRYVLVAFFHGGEKPAPPLPPPTPPAKGAEPEGRTSPSGLHKTGQLTKLSAEDSSTPAPGESVPKLPPLLKTCFPDDMMLMRRPGQVSSGSSIVDKVPACCSNSCFRVYSEYSYSPNPDSRSVTFPPPPRPPPRIPSHPPTCIPSHASCHHGPGPRLLRGAPPAVGDDDATHSLAGVRYYPARQQGQTKAHMPTRLLRVALRARVRPGHL